ncbi:unnamed protein product [Rotaria sp. Silwood1]|nr:unnamed protein product [Rotaria sp. Silwood1]
MSDLNNQLLEQNGEKNDIHLSIEKENKSRQFCCLTIEELITLFEYCPVIHRTLYESISPNKTVKAYVDFEYLVDKNLDIQNHYIAPISCLKILYYFLNGPDDTITSVETYTENILKQFLVLEASTDEKISYHFIHAKPSVLFENTSILGIFIKAIVHFLLLSITQHKCSMFNINLSKEECSSTSNLMHHLAPSLNTLRKNCTRYPSSFCNPSTIINTDRNSANSMDVNAINKLNLSATDIQIFLNFVENVITSEPSHRGYVHSCVRGTLNKNLLFFNIAVTDNAANNIKAFETLIIPGFEHYFDIEDDDNDENGSDVDLDGFSDDDDHDESAVPVININDSNMIELIKNINDGLKQVSSIESDLSKVSKIAKLSHTSTAFAEKLENTGKSIPKANKTGWNSQFNTVEKILRIPPSELNEMLILVKRKDLCLLTKDYQMLNEFVSLLTLFADATTITQAENTPSISFIAPTVLAIYYDLVNEQSNVFYTSSLCHTRVAPVPVLTDTGSGFRTETDGTDWNRNRNR